MIFIHAKIECDHYSCNAAIDVSLELTTDNRDIPVIKVAHYPEGWILLDGGHCCPDHNPYKQKHT